MMLVGDLMTTNVLTLHETDTLYDARRLMEQAKIRHVPVVDNRETFKGLLTHRDLLAHAISRLADINPAERTEIEIGLPVSAIMRTDVTTTTKDTALRTAAQILYANKYGCLPVLEGDRLAGIVTEADFVRLAIALLQA